MLKKLNRYLTKFRAFLLIVALIAGMAGCNGGGGPVLPPSKNLEISTWYDLDDVRDNLEGNHTLMNDLNCTSPGYSELASSTANGGKGWQPIGFWDWQYGFYGPVFSGSFDGQGHEIRDLYINRPDEIYVGLFGIMDEEVVIKDIGVMNVTVTGDHYVGGLAGAGGTYINCYSTGSITGNDEVGGLVGHIAYKPMVNSYSMSSVTGGSSVGGLVGQNSGNISDSYSAGTVTGTNDVGGLAGFQYFGDVSNSYSMSSVTGSSSVGGLIGRNECLMPGEDSCNLNNCYSTGSVSGSSSVGGLVGENNYGTVTNSFWDIESSGQSTSAGGTGQNTTEMQDIATFSGVGWNITAVAMNETNPAYIWNIVSNVTYPFLSWQPV
jgi:hypothetical protein